MYRYHIFIILNIFCNAFTLANAQTNIVVNTATAHQKSISPYIYGINPYHWDPAITGMNIHVPGINVTSLRFGGDAVSTYNWENNTNISWNISCNSTYATNENNQYLAYASGQSNTNFGNKAGAILKMYADAANINAYSLVQLTAMRYASKDASGCLGTACGQGTASGRMVEVFTTKPGGALSLTPNTIDNAAYTDEELFYLKAQSGFPTGLHGFCLENEPGIWHETHPCAHPNRATCNEVLYKNIDLAKRIKAIDPGAEIFGPGMWGFTEYTQLNYTTSQPVPTDWSSYNMSDVPFNPNLYNSMTWMCSYLRKMSEASISYGSRLLDVLDLHFYNEGNNLSQDSRSFWDSTYVENSWITNNVINGASIKLIHCIKKAISDWYPSTKIGITEWGSLDYNNVQSGTYIADMLGAFGKNDVYLANYFGVLQGFAAGAFKIFRNYDNLMGVFPEISVLAKSSDNSKISAYAAIRHNNDSILHIIIINITNSQQLVSIGINASINYGTLQGYAMKSINAGAITPLTSIINITSNTLQISIDENSVYHLIMRSGSVEVSKIDRSKFQIYPNPAKDFLYVDIPSEPHSKIRIVNMLGQCVMQQNWSELPKNKSISIKDLAAGFYYLQIENSTRLFIKQD
ncbi:MAG: T9SS type A sorting domain-containing protein [Bacteroidetes bacterium]|nr:T9SS type A sorting domain-containing protein [Bacteroidota bacterium]